MKVDHVLFVGLGGTGGYLAEPLLRTLSYHPQGTSSILLADPDEFEEHNSARQIMDSEAVGQTKAAYHHRVLAAKGFETEVYDEEYVTYTWTKRYLRRHHGFVLVVVNVDNHPSRELTLRACADSRSDFLWVSGGNGTEKGQVMTWGRYTDKDTTQYIGMDPRLNHPDIANPTIAPPRKEGRMLAAFSAPQTLAANFTSAAWTLAVIQGFLDDLPLPDELLFSNVRFKTEPMELTPPFTQTAD